MEMNKKEIEKKFLIRYPSNEVLSRIGEGKRSRKWSTETQSNTELHCTNSKIIHSTLQLSSLRAFYIALMLTCHGKNPQQRL